MSSSFICKDWNSMLPPDNNSNQPPPLTSSDLAIIRRYLVTRFNLDELNPLTSDIGIGDGSFTSPTNLEKYAVELLNAAMQTRKLLELVEGAWEQRQAEAGNQIEVLLARLRKGASYPAKFPDVTAIPTSINMTPHPRTCPTPPARPDYFGGRDVPLAELNAKLKAGKNTAIVAVAGLGGIGKTTLARKVVNDLYEQQVFRAVLWANVGQEPQPHTLLESWATYADPTYQASADKPLTAVALHVKSLLEGVIDEKCQECPPLNRTLVVLDNVWDTSLETTRLLKQACPANSTILITSRSHNAAIDLGANVQTLDRLTNAEATALLSQYLPPDVNQAKLAELGQVLGGHPLALTLAAKRILKAATPPTTALTTHLKEYAT
jgi:hypothetical protein